MPDNIFHINKKIKIENNKYFNEKNNEIIINNKIIKNKKINFFKIIQYQQIYFCNNNYMKRIKNKFEEKISEYNTNTNINYCKGDHTFKYYPFVNNGTCRFCLKKKPKSEKDLLNESYHELF